MKNKSPKAVMSYEDTIAWIALNDEPLDRYVNSIKGYISVILAADIFGVDAFDVALKVVKYREKHEVGL